MKLRQLVAQLIENEDTQFISVQQKEHPLYKITDLLIELASEEKIKNFPNTSKECYGGVAMSPAGAIEIVTKDPLRTVRFICGLQDAIKEALKKFPGEIIRIADIGCGPLAILSVAALTQFLDQPIELYLVDAFPEAIESSQNIIEKLGISNLLKNSFVGDAAVMDFSMKFHVIVAEVMDQALSHEPQVAVTANVGKFLETEGFFLPEKVTVTAVIEDENNKMLMHPIVKLTPKNASKIVILQANGSILVEHEFLLPPGGGQHHLFSFDTTVDIFGHYKLKGADSTITQRTFIKKETLIPQTEYKIIIKHYLGDPRSALRIYSDIQVASKFSI